MFSLPLKDLISDFYYITPVIGDVFKQTLQNFLTIHFKIKHVSFNAEAEALFLNSPGGLEKCGSALTEVT